MRLQRRLGRWVTLRDDALDAELGRLHVAPAADGAQPGARAVRPGARPARRHADRHHPRLLPVAAAPLPAGGAHLAAFPAGRGPRRRPRRCATRARHMLAAAGHPEAARRRLTALAGLVAARRIRPAGCRALRATASGWPARCGLPRPGCRAAARARRRRAGRGQPDRRARSSWPARAGAAATLPRMSQQHGSRRMRRAERGAMLDWLGLPRMPRRALAGWTVARLVPPADGKPRALRAASSTRSLRQAHPDAGRAAPGRSGAYRARSRTIARAAGGRRPRPPC